MSARELIAVGLASVEGNIEAEIQRGGLRANRIAEWVRGAVDPSIPMSTLNLGRYLEPCSDCETADTSWQRPFIVIAVKQADSRHQHRRSPAKRHVRQGKPAEPEPVLDVCAEQVSEVAAGEMRSARSHFVSFRSHGC